MAMAKRKMGESQMEGKLTRDSTRLEWIDIGRGAVMLCVILGHMNVGPLMTVIFTFHMPFFFFLSGFFWRAGKCKDYILNKAQSLLFPYIFTVMIVVLLGILMEPLKGMVNGVPARSAGTVAKDWLIAGLLGSGSRKDYLLFDFAGDSIGAVWFLLAMFFSMSIFNWLMQKDYGWLYVVGIAAAGLISAKYFWLVWSVQAGAVALIFVLIGHLFSGDRLNRILSHRWLILGCYCFWGVYVVLSIRRGVLLGMVDARLPLGMLDCIGATSAIIAILWFCRTIITHMKRLGAFLSWFGQNSLIVLCFHLVELNTIPWGGLISY